MKKKFFYDTVDDANRRLSSTVVLFKGDPVWIHDVRGLNTDQVATIQDLPWKDQKSKQTPLTSETFSVRNLPPLGYVDHKSHSFYLVRKPARQGKQGYCRSNVEILPSPDVVAPNFEGLISNTGLLDMFRNEYSPFKTVYDMMMESIQNEGTMKKAFSRTLALAVDDMESIILEHRGTKVGVANNPRKYGPTFRILDRYHFLKEELIENGIKLEAA